MKILLISLPRTGSTSLLNSLSKTLSIKSYNIPDRFKYDINKKYIDKILSNDSFIVRMSPSQFNDIKLDCNIFNFTILLSRKNEKLHYESIVNLYYKEIVLKKDAFLPYDFNEIPKKICERFVNSDEWNDLLFQKNIITKISNQYDIDILYYEDLFYSQSGINLLQQKIENFNVELFKEIISSTKKIRKFTNKKII